jgi:DNA-directed RNA polymerase, mitochondrial
MYFALLTAAAIGSALIGFINGLGVDDDGQKNYRDIALWIGRCFNQRKNKLALKVGAWGVNMLVTALPTLFTLEGDVLTLPLTDDLDSFLTGIIERAGKSNPYLLPLATPPEPWTQYWKGGLPAGHWARVPPVQERHPSIEKAVRDAIREGRMKGVLDAVNSLQAAPFIINQPVLDFLRGDPGDPIPDVPDPNLPWRQREEIESERRKAIGKLVARRMDCTIAERLAYQGRFYVPLNMDFRGRLYGIPHFNFAREDHVRALFLFAVGEPIGEQGLKYLKAHVAAHAEGWSVFQKPSSFNLELRVAWTDLHLPRLRETAEAVLHGKTPPWGLPKKEPYQFLAACIELVQALDAGPEFITRLPLTFDGSCSGLQHLCQMMRPEEGRYVNLVPRQKGTSQDAGALGNHPHSDRSDWQSAADIAEDLYSRVAGEVYLHCGGLMEGPFDRALVKRSVMSFFYGSEPGRFSKNKSGRWVAHGMTKQVYDVLKEREMPHHIDRQSWSTNAKLIARRMFEQMAAKLLADEIYKAIEHMVPRAKEVRDRLQQLVELCAEENKPLRWTTPLGLPVQNRYHLPEIEIISVTLNGRRRRAKLVVDDKEGIDKKKAVNAVAANFVHSLDAAHLQSIALAAREERISMVSVHDCFGCLAPRAKRFKEIICEQFIRLQEPYLLAGVWESARRDLSAAGRKKLPPLPVRGDAELEPSDHAFA